MDYVILILLIIVVFLLISLGLIILAAHLIDEKIEIREENDNTYKD